MLSHTPVWQSEDLLNLRKYMQKIRKSSNKFYLKKLHPPSTACRYHPYIAYYQVQEWPGNPSDLDATQWGWKVLDEDLPPRLTDRA